MEEKNKRNSSLELLRIICMILIIAHHYSVHGGFSPLSLENLSMERMFIRIIGMFGRVSTSVFILISGYFLVTSDTKKYYRKIVHLMAEMLFYSIILYCIMALVSPPLKLDGKKIFEMFFPVFWGNWFVVYYILLYVLSPFINIWLKAMSRKTYTIFMIISVC